jgi:hypothetical protein
MLVPEIVTAPDRTIQARPPEELYQAMKPRQSVR